MSAISGSFNAPADFLVFLLGLAAGLAAALGAALAGAFAGALIGVLAAGLAIALGAALAMTLAATLVATLTGGLAAGFTEDFAAGLATVLAGTLALEATFDFDTGTGTTFFLGAGAAFLGATTFRFATGLTAVFLAVFLADWTGLADLAEGIGRPQNNKNTQERTASFSVKQGKTKGKTANEHGEQRRNGDEKGKM
jgi:hypothetical protein